MTLPNVNNAMLKMFAGCRNYNLTISCKRHFKYRKILNSRNYHISLSLNATQKLVKETSVNLSNEKCLKLSTGRYARFADGSAVASLGDTDVMATVVSKNRNAAAPFLPLTVDYRQKAAALGRIPTNFLRRELGPTDQETLTSRIIDRSIRPLFPAGYSADTQVVCSPLALDGVNNPDVLAINAASLALATSDIPWNGPVGAVRVASCAGNLIVNPSKRELQHSCLNLVITATKQNLLIMLEGAADNMLLPDFQQAIKFGVKECQSVVRAIEQISQDSVSEKRQFAVIEIPDEVFDAVRSLSEMRLREIFSDVSHDKISRDTAVSAVRTDVIDKLHSTESAHVSDAFNKIAKEVFRKLIFETNIRCDGRRLNQLRDISCSVDLYRPLHGSSLFQRGQTQVLSTVTLDSPAAALKMDAVSTLTSGLKEKNFFLHYEFPPYATNDVGRMSGVGRREVGHGALAEKALKSIVPSDFMFTLRLSAEVLESNGSSSMAAVCGGSLAMMDAGVPVSSAAAGVAIGLVTVPGADPKHIEDYRILTDILGIEDFLGDMDFKMAGTKKGVTAVQADIKLPGLPLKIVMEALQAGTEGKSEIIDIMNETIRHPRKSQRGNWPVMEKLSVPVHKRARFLGMGGVNVKKLELQTGVQVTQEDGVSADFLLFAPNQAAMDEAQEMIKTLLEGEPEPTLEFGAIYNAKIVEIRDIGVMITLYANMAPVLVHNSQLDQRKINHPSALGLEAGQEIRVKYFGRDPVSGVMRLSRKVLQTTTSSAPRSLDKSS